MKRFLRFFIATIILSAYAASCDGGEDSTIEQEHPVESIGSYTFDGIRYDIVYGCYHEDDIGYYFAFSPQSESDRDTIFYFGLSKYFEGAMQDVTKLYVNGDYFFSYEDSVRYYPEDQPLKSGDVSVTHRGNGFFEILVDVELPDGKPFSLDFSGKLEKVENIENETGISDN